MFNVITIVVTVVVMIALVLAGITYLGPMFTDTGARTRLGTYLNQGAQIHGALHLYEAQNNGAEPPGTGQAQVQALVDAGYLKEVPNIAWSIDTLAVFRDIKTQNECVRLNAAANMDLSSPGIVAFHGCPPCADSQYSGYPACTKNDGTQAVQAGG